MKGKTPTDRIQIMKQQEDTIYRKKVALRSDDNDNDAPDADCRDKMLTWFLDIANYFHYNKETVEIALNYLDRYECTDRVEYQLTCMTALYTAVKIHERTALHPNLVASLSQGQYEAADIVQHERKLLQKLQWRLHPPTSLAFVRELLPCVPKDLRRAVYERAQVFLQQAMRSCRLVPTYILAYAAVVNALDGLNVVQGKYELALALGVDGNDPLVVKTQWSLQKRSIPVRVSSKLAAGGASPRTVAAIL